MEKTIQQLISAERAIDDGDMVLRRALPQPGRDNVGPFVFVDHYRHQSRRGIGDRPHPHAGIEVISYLFEGGVEHRDSMGFHDRLQAGDAQHIRSGRGMLHAEQPLGGRHGLQLWLVLPPELADTAPQYLKIEAAAIPHFAQDGVSGEVVAGHVNGHDGPMQLSGGGVFANARLDAGATARLQVPAAKELAVYVADGEISVGGQALPTGTLALLGTGDEVVLSATAAQGAQVALIGGDPLSQALHFAGPFVAASQDRLARMYSDYRSGKMGTLEGVPF